MKNNSFFILLLIALSVLPCTAKKNSALANSKTTEITKGMIQLTLAGTSLLGTLASTGFCYKLYQDFRKCGLEIDEGLKKYPPFKVFLVKYFFAFSTAMTALSWSVLSYKFARSGIESFKKAAKPAGDDEIVGLEDTTT